jgi:RHS repeat-associated protein
VRTFYDALDRTTRVEQDSEHGILATTTEYLSSLQLRTTNPRGLQTTTSFMAWDQPGYDLPILSQQPEGKTIQISRHPQFGWPLSLTQRNAANTLSQTRRYVYDGNAQLCKTIEPETGATVTGYDAAGNPAWSAAGLAANDPNYSSTTDCSYTAANASGRVVNRIYDTRNRLSQLQFPDGRGNQIWTYANDGLPVSITTYNDPGNTNPVVNAYTYNNRRLLAGESVSQPDWYTWSSGYGYDALGHLASQTYPTGLVVGYAPNALGQATQAGTYATGAQYYPNGALKQFTYGNGIVHTMTQNARQMPQRVTSSGGALDYTYLYDANGNPEHIANELVPGYDLRDRWMTYDGLDRLTDAGSGSFGGDHWHRYTYDALDNMRSWKLAGVKDYAEYVYDNTTNRLTSIRNTAGATVMGLDYDLQGNLYNKNGQIYNFDYGNRLRDVPGKESYRYDGLGRRVQTTKSDGSKTTLWQYSQAGQMMFSSDWDGANYANHKTHENVYLAGSLVAMIDHDWPSNAVIATKYQHTDALGSPVAVTNQSGAVIERNDYEPYGAIIGKPTYNGIGYTGHVMDGTTGLTYMQQRYYDPSIGRFLSRDPVTANPNTGTNFNAYWYANNNPYSFKDPDGRKCTTTAAKNSCTFDEFKDKKGNTMTREQALSGGNKLTRALGIDRGSRILRAEAGMTEKYTAAKALAAKGGDVTIKGNQALGIPDQKVSGVAIVGQMESVRTIANDSSKPGNSNSAASTQVALNTGYISNTPINFWSTGRSSDTAQTFGHEILHTLYSGAGLPNGGWTNGNFNLDHQTPFNDASDAIK